jgi:hypothetical protein
VGHARSPEREARPLRRPEARHAGEIRGIAAFLDIPIDEARWEAIVEHCSFDWMKRNATKSVPLGGAFWDAGAEVFIHKGVNGRWRDTLSEAEGADVGDHEKARNSCRPKDRRPKRFWAAPGVVHRDA